MNTIDKLRRDPRIASAHDEGDDGYWVLLKPGYVDGESLCHALHEHTLASLQAGMRKVVPCNCPECQSATI